MPRIRMTARFFELLNHVGVAADGEPEPLVATSLLAHVPVMRGQEVVFVTRRFLVRPLEGHHRTVKVTDPVIAELLMQTGNYREVDPPKSQQTRTTRQEA